jgi:putative acetyltransferase
LPDCNLTTMQNNSVEIRPICRQDNRELAGIIRATLAEFGANKPGTVYYDESTDRLSEVFDRKDSAYYVLLWNGEIAGGAGIFPTRGLPEGTCELVKMYLMPHARGRGFGYELLIRCSRFAAEFGYRKMYLETLPELSLAISLYERFGFQRLDAPLGNTGHTGCNIWMIRDIHPD